MLAAQRRSTREIGTALAVLAMYVLTLLLPLHQAAGLQRDLNALGYSTLSSWSICQPLATDDHGQPNAATAVKCPAAGMTKQPFAALPPPGPVLSVAVATLMLPRMPPYGAAFPVRPDHVGQSRAPPASV